MHLPVQEPRAANDPPAQEVKAARWKDPPWLSWDDVPTDVHWVASLGPWFIEVFSGTARLTHHHRLKGHIGSSNPSVA